MPYKILPVAEKSEMEPSQNRKEFVRYFFNALVNIDYALLKYTSATLNDIPETSDIDLLVAESQLSAIIKIINDGSKVEHVQVHSKSFVSFVSIYFKDQGYLELDLIHRFDRKGTIYLEAEDVLRNAMSNTEGLKLASHYHHFEYVMLFYLLNGEEVPYRYQSYFTALNANDRVQIFSYLCDKYKLHINTLDDLYEPHKRHRKKIVTTISNYNTNKGLSKLGNKANYVSDLLRDVKYCRGYVISFSGVDGAGKSTVLENINDTLKNKYRQRTILLRHRPSILPILSSFVHGKNNAQERAKNSLPRQGKNQSSVLSFFRFGYYFADYIVGQWYLYFKYILRGYTVLYDRYYFDFIADPKRTNIVISKWITKGLYFFIYKPQINIFLFAPPETILKRKQELNVEDIKSLTNEYKQVFDEFESKYSKQKYLSINNISLEDTLKIVIDECITTRNK